MTDTPAWNPPALSTRDNRLPPPVKVGDPATYSIGSDRYAMVVTAVLRNRREVHAEGVDGGMMRAFTWRPGAAVGNPRGRYITKGGTYCTLTIGIAEDYRDPSF